MKLSNYRDFENVCEQRGQNADAYLKEIDELIQIRGLYNLEFYDVSYQNYIDKFQLEENSVWELTNGSDVIISKFCDLRKNPNGFWRSKELSPPIYRFVLS